ncbi:TPA: hypothetical protein ACF5AY_005529, partial [Escherichia coli]
WEEMTCLFAPSLTIPDKLWDQIQASKGTGWFPLMD